ncbi:hypothetical protein AMECASPLE_020097 [Ameca splendens]|uniref:PHD-type domain-containing protein n=1 Tax=Ameca splendens TaxID=208324 RepID=A0ABV0YEA4_9TELE
MTFSTAKPNIVKDRVSFALQILELSAFDMDHNCAMCSASKPPMPGPALTDWIQCDSCIRWYHLQCMNMDPAEVPERAKTAWDCPLCH